MSLLIHLFYEVCCSYLDTLAVQGSFLHQTVQQIATNFLASMGSDTSNNFYSEKILPNTMYVTVLSFFLKKDTNSGC